jgi:hypothetical protein
MIWDLMFPEITKINGLYFIILSAIFFGLSYWYLRTLLVNKKRKENETSPNIEILGYGVDKNVLAGFNIYGGSSSYLMGFLRGNGELIYLDIVNSPEKRDGDNSLAKKVSVNVRFYDWENGDSLYKEFFAKWLIPENKSAIEAGIDIPADGIGKRLGIGVRKQKDNILWLLDMTQAIINESEQLSILSKLECLNPSYEKCVMVVEIMGSNIEQKKYYFEILNERNGQLGINEMEDGEYWLNTAKESSKDFWETLNK